MGGTISPWLPHTIAARVAAHDAAERILTAVSGPDACSIRTWVTGDAVHLCFAVARDGAIQTRHEIEPLLLAACS